jgi:hypothetical protein
MVKKTFTSEQIISKFGKEEVLIILSDRHLQNYPKYCVYAADTHQEKIFANFEI